MSNKPRRDITLGEMQDECSFRGHNCETIGGDKCKFFELCATMQTIDKGCLTPIMWNLTDPPRFTEAQMALLKVLYASGVVKIVFGATNDLLRCLDAEFNMAAGLFWEKIGLPREEIDLAELLGKDGESK